MQYAHYHDDAHICHIRAELCRYYHNVSRSRLSLRCRKGRRDVSSDVRWRRANPRCTVTAREKETLLLAARPRINRVAQRRRRCDPGAARPRTPSRTRARARPSWRTASPPVKEGVRAVHAGSIGGALTSRDGRWCLEQRSRARSGRLAFRWAFGAGGCASARQSQPRPSW